MPDFITSKISELEGSGGFLPPQRPRVAGTAARIVVFLTVWIRRNSDTPSGQGWQKETFVGPELGRVHIQIVFLNPFNQRCSLHTQ